METTSEMMKLNGTTGTETKFLVDNEIISEFDIEELRENLTNREFARFWKKVRMINIRWVWEFGITPQGYPTLYRVNREYFDAVTGEKLNLE